MVVALGILYNSIRAIYLDLAVNPPGPCHLDRFAFGLCEFHVSKYTICPLKNWIIGIKSISKNTKWMLIVSILCDLVFWAVSSGFLSSILLELVIVALAILKTSFQLMMITIMLY